MNRNVFRSLFRAMWLGFIRDRRALLFTMLIPLIFLFIFGGLFGHATTTKVSVLEVGQVGVLDQAMAGSGGQLAKTLKVTKTDDLAAALKKVKNGDDTAAIQQVGDQLVVHYSAADQVKAGTVQGILTAVVQSANQAASGRPATFHLVTQQVEDKSLKLIQYYVPGLLGWAIASAGMVGAAVTLVNWRTKGILRRLRLSPTPISGVFAARITVSLAVALVQAVVFLGIGTAVFGLKLSHYWWMSLPLILCGTLSFLAIGLLIGAWAKTQDSAQGATQLVILPMAFLGGSFIPAAGLPGWLNVLSNILPLRHLNDGMLKVLVRGEGPVSVLPQMGILLAFAAVAAIIASRLFKWDDT